MFFRFFGVLFAGIFISSALISFAGSARAQVAACRDYASTAVEQNERNERWGCGYAGARWQSNGRAHFRWCMGASPRQRASETEARNDLLRRCRGRRGDRREECREYAETAVEQNERNERWGCGYAGARWQDDGRAHFRWCMGASPRQRASETDARDDLLRRCRGRRGDRREECREYAETAVEQNRRNERWGCGYAGARWQDDGRAHFRWCMRASPRQRANETDARDDLLRRCRGRRGWRGSCDLRNARIYVQSPGCNVSAEIPFARARIGDGDRIRQSFDSGVIGRGYTPYGVCNFHTEMVYRCERGRLVIDQVIECRQNRTGPRSASCSVIN